MQDNLLLNELDILKAELNRFRNLDNPKIQEALAIEEQQDRRQHAYITGNTTCN